MFDYSKRNVKVIGLSCSDISSHKGWIQDIEKYSGEKVNYSIIADKSRLIAATLGTLSSNGLDKAG